MIRNLCCIVLLLNLASCQLIPIFPFRKSRCYGELGCLEWNLIHPQPRKVIDTKFVLYTRKSVTDGEKLTVARDKYISNTNFNSSKETKFIIHGFHDSTRFTCWLKRMRVELLNRGDMNVFEVDWDKGSVPPYPQATANTRLVGLEVAHFINHLKASYGLNPADLHIIGHSLGAHIAGFAGEKIPGLGRITGLDPAGPLFEGLGTHLRLDPSDATFVDVIHTDLSGFGLSEPCGHLDFYPNNGENQPGCGQMFSYLSLEWLLNCGLQEFVGDAVACSHLRVISLFIESINSHCPFIGLRCSDYGMFLKGQCHSSRDNSSDCAEMGYGVKQVHGLRLAKYFLSTNDKAPYCRTPQPGRIEKCSFPQT